MKLRALFPLRAGCVGLLLLVAAASGIPAGLAFLGLPYSEPTLIKLAYAYEQTTHHRKPPASTPPLPAGS
jgi:Asp-tRNA(Asn)/Glu-tRNA(Gln) amidotransferase A subunit family amidase